CSKEALQRISHGCVQVVGDLVVIRIVGWVEFRDQRIPHRGMEEVTVTSAVRARPWQVRASVRGIVCRDNYTAGQQMLESQIPLVDLGIARRSGIHVISVVEAPFSKVTVLCPLRLS